jgi:hypothetical protein
MLTSLAWSWPNADTCRGQCLAARVQGHEMLTGWQHKRTTSKHGACPPPGPCRLDASGYCQGLTVSLMDQKRDHDWIYNLC